MLAALQAPVIMMSQIRLASKDRAAAGHDYEVNLKAELEILALHQKIDALRKEQWTELLAMQQEQTRLLTRVLEGRDTPPSAEAGPPRSGATADHLVSRPGDHAESCESS